MQSLQLVKHQLKQESLVMKNNTEILTKYANHTLHNHDSISCN